MIEEERENTLMRYLVAVALAVLVAVCILGFITTANAAPVFTAPGIALDDRMDYRYGIGINRNPDGTIHRSAAVISAFRKTHPCPSTGFTTGACPGWAINHNCPIACGCVDAVWNMSWMRNDVKKIVDGYERKINAATPPIPDTAACVNQIVP